MGIIVSTIRVGKIGFPGVKALYRRRSVVMLIVTILIIFSTVRLSNEGYKHLTILYSLLTIATFLCFLVLFQTGRHGSPGMAIVSIATLSLRLLMGVILDLYRVSNNVLADSVQLGIMFVSFLLMSLYVVFSILGYRRLRELHAAGQTNTGGRAGFAPLTGDPGTTGTQPQYVTTQPQPAYAPTQPQPVYNPKSGTEV